MPIDSNRLPPIELRGYDLVERGDTLRIVLKRQLDTDRSADRWAQALALACPGGWQRVEVDARAMVLLTSTIIAGLVHLADQFAKQGCGKLVLVGASGRIARSLHMVKLTDLFVIEEPRAAPA